MKKIRNLLLHTTAASLCVVAYAQTAPPYPVTLWSTAMAGNSTRYTADQYMSVAFPDLNADGVSDLCYRDQDGIVCGISNGSGSFTSLHHWTNNGDFGATWSGHEYYWQTIQYADVTGDHRADVCGRGPDGIYCALSTGNSFGPAMRWTSDFGDQSGWHTDASYWKTIRLVDLNHNGLADICGRGAAGIYCAMSTGASFGPATLWSSQYSNANQWNSDASYWSTIQYPDVSGDDLPDVCGRGGAGIVCAINNGRPFPPVNGTQFVNVALWTQQYSDAAGWRAPEYYSTIHFADIDGGGKADVCGRGGAGFYCGLSTGVSFVGTEAVYAREFSDQNGWNTEPHYKSLWLVDNFGGLPAICGRGWDGIYCARSLSSFGAIRFTPADLWIKNFADKDGWATHPSYWATVQPAHPISSGLGTGFCGRGDSGILCSWYPPNAPF